MRYVHSTFINSIHVQETKDREYVFSFINTFSRDNYVFAIDKRLFDKGFKDRVIQEYKEPYKPEPPEIPEPPVMTS